MHRWIVHCFFGISILVCLLAYWPGLNGPFVFDDSVNVTKNTRIDIQDLSAESLKLAATSSPSGPLMRPISMISFALNRYLSGLDPFYFKLTNLLIHLFNGVGIFILTLLLMRQYRLKSEPALTIAHASWLGLVIASAWLLHPLNLTTVLYTVQRMTGLAGLFTIFGLVLFTWGRTLLGADKKGSIFMLASALLFLPLAALSKETGLLLPAFYLLIEICFFRFDTNSQATRSFLSWFYIITVGIPLILAIAFLVSRWDGFMAGYMTREFSLSERLMTETRVLWFYLQQIITPNNAQLGLYHDDIEISKGLFAPVSTTFAITGLVILVGLAMSLWKKASVVTFGILFFLIGHILESTILPLEIAHEHRNYIPMYGIIFMFFFYMLYPLRYRTNLWLRGTVVLLLICLFAFNTHARSKQWSNPYDLFQAEVEHHPSSAIANGELGALYSNFFIPDPDVMENYYQLASQYFDTAARLNQNDTKPLFAQIWLDANRSKPIRQELIDELKNRLAVAPYAAISSDKLIMLIMCIEETRCELPDSGFETLVEAALINPTLEGVHRIKVLHAYSIYLINNSKNYPKAIEIMQQMITINPDQLEHRVALIKFLTALELYSDARKELMKLKSTPHVQNIDIGTLEQNLAH